ncbi:MAG: D-amino-acid dehydrogenase, partial [Ilumatobacteraceae bacterium]|nr:D-amino-acid dehydrogenase [Ilumatobacteraceae bacterium]
LRVMQAAHDTRDEALRSLDPREWPTTQPQAGETTEPSFDAVVVCAAVDSRPLLKRLGIRLPLLAVHGYSVTAPLRHDDAHLHLEPRAALMDERYKVAISRLGQRVRVAGSAEIGGDSERQSERAQATLDKVLDDWFPGVTRRNAAQRWKGARPMLPDGPPVLGPSGAAGVWLNVGHGGSGWALSAGSARLLADAIGLRAVVVDDDDRAAYHAAASVASNFLVTLEDAAEALLATTGIERALLVPLVRAAVETWADLGGPAALTGPVARGDEATIARQRAAIAERAPDMLELFDTMTSATRALAARSGGATSSRSGSPVSRRQP